MNASEPMNALSIADQRLAVANLLAAVRSIDTFDAECAAAEYTDTGDAWELFNAVRQDCFQALSAILGERKASAAVKS